MHTGGVNGVLLTRDGRTSITYAKDCTARVWDVDTNSVTRVIEGHPEGVKLAMLSPDEVNLKIQTFEHVFLKNNVVKKVTLC